MVTTNTPAGFVSQGDPATMRYVTDTVAMVVVGVTPKSIRTRRVVTGPARRDEACDVGAYGLGVTVEDGILDQPIAGTETIFRWSEKKQAFFSHGRRLILGRSQSRRDWRD